MEPSHRPHNHHTPLVPNTQPIRVKLYHNPHHHKEVITQLIADMLQEGIIKPNTNHFSSPILLIKKDGYWCLCVDYRALNAVTIRDRFPIPTIDELLDEIGLATVFSKRDLYLVYHKILLL